MSLALSELKRNKAYLLGVLGVEKAGQHVKCPFHEDAHGSMSVYVKDEVWRWKCHGCDQGGSIIDAAILQYGAKGAKDAVRAIERNLGVTIFRDEAPAIPVIDIERAETFVAQAHAELLGSFDAMALLEEKRNITNLDNIKRFRLGYVDDYELYSEWSWYTGWILPVTDKRGRLTAVKVHSESRHGKRLSDIRKIPKCMWVPFGTTKKPGSNKMLHGWSTLWPGPEGCERQTLYMAGGELKALRLIDFGYHATAPTAGENTMPLHLINRIRAAKPKNIVVIYDDDTAGEKWRGTMLKSLSKVGIRCSAFTLGAAPPPEDLDAEWTAAAEVKVTNPQEEFERLEKLLPTAPESARKSIEKQMVLLLDRIAHG